MTEENSMARTEFFIPEIKNECDMRAALIGELVKTRKERRISRERLEQLSGVRQPVIARMENGGPSPQIDTVLKVLAPLGKTLAVVSVEQTEAAAGLEAPAEPYLGQQVPELA